MKILVINGPNINMLGIREPEVYGKTTYQELIRIIEQAAEELGVEVTCFQSNSQGAIVDAVQAAYGVYNGIVINPAGYTTNGIAIMDAMKSVNIPAVEVHITDISKREEFRRNSIIKLACFDAVVGEGISGYAKALAILKNHLENGSKES
ncbi:MAG: 3-dehydroquinate dehydratase [Chloroflexi bacterium]|nr:3-dehydroquinate dehydratase [Chloroflexota bacterium]